MYTSPILQAFVNNVPVRESHSDKSINQPGALRKVCKTRKIYGASSLC